MVHNGIEYADMQLIAEAYDLLGQGAGMGAATLAEVFERWNQGDLDSFLIETTAKVLRQVDQATGRPLVEVILDQAEQKGTGRWTSSRPWSWAASPRRCSPGSCRPRNSSGRPRPRSWGPGVLPVAGRAGFVDDVRDALYASKVVAYAQGFEQIAAAADAMAGSSWAGWPPSGGAAASSGPGSWTASARPMRPTRACEICCSPGTSKTPSADAQDAWRRVVATAVTLGVPTPAFASSLAYYDGFRRERGPANLLQAQRDFFGAHTYRRTDRPGSFHTRWSEDGQEVEA